MGQSRSLSFVKGEFFRVSFPTPQFVKVLIWLYSDEHDPHTNQNMFRVSVYSGARYHKTSNAY